MKIVTNRKDLTEPCDFVEDDEVSVLKIKLAVAMKQFIGKGYAIAANQIGIQKRAFVMNRGAGRFMFFVNPILLKKRGEQYISREGCLSLPKAGELNVMRWNEIVVTDDVNGKQTLKGLRSAIWQHEVDHLDGKLIDQKEVK